MRLRASYVNTRWEVILQEMQEELYDCIIGGITITPARQKNSRVVGFLHDDDTEPGGEWQKVT